MCAFILVSKWFYCVWECVSKNNTERSDIFTPSVCFSPPLTHTDSSGSLPSHTQPLFHRCRGISPHFSSQSWGVALRLAGGWWWWESAGQGGWAWCSGTQFPWLRWLPNLASSAPRQALLSGGFCFWCPLFNWCYGEEKRSVWHITHAAFSCHTHTAGNMSLVF